MAFKFRIGEHAGDGLRRMAREQIDQALGEIADSGLPSHKTVHQVRKRCKKLRALLRLARGDLDRSGKVYRRENACFRDAARSLSSVRDAEVLLQTCDLLVGEHAEAGNRQRLQQVREVFEQRRHEVENANVDLDERIATVALTLREARERVDGWPVGNDFDALLPGLKATYRAARKAMKKAIKKPTTENLHEWRKHVKYHLYHVQVLRPAWNSVLKAWRNELKDLGENLGDDHDLAVFAQTLLDEQDHFACNRELRVLVGLSDRRRARLQAMMFPLGQRLFAEKPKRLAGRFETYWDASHSPVPG